MRAIQRLSLVCSLLIAAAVRTAADEPATLVGWGVDKKNTDAFFAQAKDVGFDALITWSTEPAFLAKAVAAGEKHGIQVFSSLAPMSGFARRWKQEHPGQPVPWQIMTEDEEAAQKFLAAGRNKYITPYQHGGEPTMTHEVLLSKIICLSSSEAKQLFETQIDEILSVQGIAGIAFDGFGYQNYRRCHCPRCQKLLDAHRKEHPDLAEKTSESDFFRIMLVEYINHLSDYARVKRADAKTTAHIWPVFAPEPLYGNRLDMDFCGQTAAWFTIWPEDKIASYAAIISGKAKEFHKRQQGVGMIGYYSRPNAFPFKSAERVGLELRTMIENGCHRIQVCSAGDVIRNPVIAAVFRKYCK